MTSPFIADLVAWAQATPDEIAVASPSESITVGRLARLVAGTAASLRSHGVNAGDVVAVSVDGIDEIAAFLAVNAAGAIPVLTPSETEFLAAKAKRLVHFDREWAPTDAIVFQSTLMESDEGIRDRNAEAPAAAILTSGTTGTPKLLLIDNTTIDARMVGYTDWWPTADYVNLFRLSAVSGLFALIAAFRTRTTYNSISVIDTRAAEFCRDRRIVRISGSPHQIHALVDAAARANVTLDLSTVTSAGAQQTTAFLRAVESVCSGEIRSVYGSTEAGGVAIAFSAVDGAFRGTVGRGAEFQVVDDTGTVLDDGVTGIIRYRAPGLATNYFVDGNVVPVATDGWFYPGDRGFIANDGQIVVERRDGDTVNVGGVIVNPLEFEALATTVDGVKDAGCAAVTFPDGSAHLVLAVVVRDQSVYQEVVRIFGGLPSHNRPNIAVAVPSIPRNRNGKLMRDELASKLTAAIRVSPGT